MRAKQVRTDEPVMQPPSTLTEWRERIGELEVEATGAEQAPRGDARSAPQGGRRRIGFRGRYRCCDRPRGGRTGTGAARGFAPRCNRTQPGRAQETGGCRAPREVGSPSVSGAQPWSPTSRQHAAAVDALFEQAAEDISRPSKACSTNTGWPVEHSTARSRAVRRGRRSLPGMRPLHRDGVRRRS